MYNGNTRTTHAGGSFIYLHKGKTIMSNATKAKANARKNKQTNPSTPKLALVPKVKAKAMKIKREPVACHALIAADFKAVKNTGRADVTEYAAFKSVLLAAPLSDLAGLRAVQFDIKQTFGDAFKDAASIRCTMLSNARKVEHGGTVDKQVIKGKGRAALLEAVDSVQSIRELRRVLTAAKPEALKDSRGGATTPPTTVKPKTDKNSKTLAPSVTVPTERAEALAAAVKVLEFVAAEFLTFQGDAATLDSINNTIKLIKAAA
jgi:hypothetical protein